MKNNSSNDVMGNEYTHLAKAVTKMFISVVELDLQTGNAVTLKSPDTEVVMKQMPWLDLLTRYTQRRSCPEDRTFILREFSAQQLTDMLATGQKTKAIDVRCGTLKEKYEWMSLAATHIEDKKLLVTTRNINEQRLLKSIVEQFVYINCDYFVLLDTKNNSFIRLMGKGDDLPPASSNNYGKTLREYNQINVAPYDVERVTAEMQIDNLIKMLEKSNEYSFHFDYKGKNGLLRKRMQLAYQDKQKGLILFSRSDITDIYNQERLVNKQLMDALTKAQIDSLTQLYNQVTTAEMITKKISSKGCNYAALLFVDVDNFKMVNDTLGHLKGDYLLKVLAKALSDLIGDRGIIGRIGGDEFIIFLPEQIAKKDIEDLCHKICNIFTVIADAQIKKLDISCSVGISLYAQDGEDYETLARKADQALYDSKRHGKNKFSFYSQKCESDFYESAISKID